MAWRPLDLVSLRLEFIKQALHPGSNVAELARRFGISRKTAYKWLARYQEEGKTGLSDKPKRPNGSPNALCDEMVNRICAIRKKYPYWGGLKIRAILEREGIKSIPSASTIQKVLKEQGFVSKKHTSPPALNRFEHEAPNRLWQMDFKGHFPYEQGRCHPLTIVDDHSRYSIILNAYSNERGETIKPGLIEVFGRYGLPERINVDNGTPWGSLYASARYTSFSLWLIEQGVTVSYSRPRHPQTNGKDERFHRTLKTEVLHNSYFRDLNEIQRRFNEWRDVYNLERPHQGIGMQVPADRYEVSYRRYVGHVEAYDYSEEYRLRKVDRRGRVTCQGRCIFVGIPFSGKHVGIRPTDEDGLVLVYYRHQKLGEIDLKEQPKGSMVNLYSKQLLST